MLCATRHLQPEVMDQPGLDQAAHRQALRGLARLNWISGSTGVLWSPIRRLARATGQRAFRVLDVASGGGDVAIRLWRRAAANGVQLDITGSDISQTAIDHANKAAAKETDAVRFTRCDMLQSPPAERFDIVTCSLFLHHLAREDAIALLRSMASVTDRLLLINDLARGPFGYALVKLGCHTLSRSPVVHIDGPRSVEGAFTPGEMRGLCEEAGLAGATVSPRFPCRFLMEWRASDVR